MRGDRELDVTEDEDVALNSVSAARARLWAGALEHRPNYGGIKDVDEVTSVAYYKRKAKSAPMVAGALHTILAAGTWAPDRAKVRGKKTDGKCPLCGILSSTEHVLWECPAVHKSYDPRRFALVGKRENGEITNSLALTGVVQAD